MTPNDVRQQTLDAAYDRLAKKADELEEAWKGDSTPLDIDVFVNDLRLVVQEYRARRTVEMLSQKKGQTTVYLPTDAVPGQQITVVADGEEVIVLEDGTATAFVRTPPNGDDDGKWVEMGVTGTKPRP